MTAFCGFPVNEGEYRLMDLAPYGEPRYRDIMSERLIRLYDDGSVRLDQRWFRYGAGKLMFHPRMGELLGGPARRPDQPGGQR